jgi:hypothetical protein
MEAVVIDWLRSLASINAVAEQLRLGWDEVDGILARAVGRARSVAAGFLPPGG